MTTPSKTAVTQELILAARKGLRPVDERSWLGGFGNMLGKELGQWWGTRTWWVQIIIWVLMLNGITTIVALSESGLAIEKIQEVVQTFLPMMVGAVGIGTIITVQGAIVGEKELGTVAWVMSKPASRSAFILAKIIAYFVGFAVCAILIPATIFYLEMPFLISAPLPGMSFLVGVAVAMLNLLFYITLTVMLGALFSSRGPIAAIGIAMILTGLLLKSLIPLAVLLYTPWLLPDLSGALALQLPLPPGWFVPLLAVSCGIIVMTAVALWRFGREEF